MAESTGEAEEGQGAPHTSPSLCSLPQPLGETLYSEPPPHHQKKAAEDWSEKAGERGSSHPGLGVLTSARLWAEQAQDSLIEGSCAAQLIAYAQGWLGHFCDNHCEEKLD